MGLKKEREKERKNQGGKEGRETKKNEERGGGGMQAKLGNGGRGPRTGRKWA